MRLTRVATPLVLVAALAAPARARTVAQADLDMNGFKEYGLVAPDRASSAVNLHFVTPGAGVLRATGIDGSIVVATPDVDYVTPSFTLGGDLSGTPASANVVGLRETSGPTHLTIGAIPDGGLTKRSGSTFIGATAGTDFENPLTFLPPLARSTDMVSISANGIGNAQLRQGAALSVIGNATGSTANVADIPATGANQFIGTNSAGTAVTWTTISPSATTGIIATWPIANTRWYCIDGTSGNDANAGYSDTSSADCGTKAKATLAGLGAIFPRVGAGRKVVVAIRSGTYTGGLHAVLAGVFGYASNFPLVVGTDTNSTAGATAFAGDAADRIYAGAVTVGGMNTAGYNPASPFSVTAIKCTKVGGGAPGFPAEPAEPDGWRVRFDSATATAALRNVAAPIIGIPASDTLSIPNLTAAGGLPATPTASDVFYIEKAGVNVDSTLLNMPNQVGTSIVSIGWPQLVGINYTAASRFDGAPLKFVFSSAASATQWSNQAEFAFAYVDEGGTSRIAGTGIRAAGSSIYNNPTGPNFTNSANCPFVSVGQTTINTSLRWSMGGGSHLAGGVALFGTRSDLTNDTSANQPTQVFGGRTINLQTPNRITGVSTALSKTAGLVLAMAEANVARLDITNAGANPAIAMIGRSALSVSSTLTGSSGNTDVGLDLTAAKGSIVLIASAPTVTGSSGDVRLANGTIVTWAQAAAGITDSAGNRLIGTTWPLRILPTGVTLDALAGSGTRFVTASAAGLLGTDSTSYTPTTRTVTGTAPILINGDNAAHSLASNLTASLAFDNVTVGLTVGNALEVRDNGVSYAKMQDVSAASRVLCRGSAAGSGDPQECTLGSGLSMSGTVLSATASGITQLTGDVLAGPGSGSVPATLANIPSGVTMAGYIAATAIAAPGTPGAGVGRVYVNSASKNIEIKDDAGVVKHGAQTFSCAANQFTTALSDAGSATCAAVAYAGITGTPTIFYQTIQNAGSALTQRAAWNAGTGLTAVDNGGSSRTDVTVNLSTGVSGGQSVVGGTGASNDLTLSSTTSGTKGRILVGGIGTSFNEATGAIVVGPGATGITARLYNPDNAANYAQLGLYPNTGTNVAQSLFMVPRGTGTGGTLAQFSMFNTDYNADATNYEIAALIARGSSGYTLATGKNGTGANRPIMLAAGWMTDGSTNNNQLLLNTNGTVTMSSLGTGIVKATSGVLSIANPGADYQAVLTPGTGIHIAANVITADLSTGIAGGQSAIGGTAAGNNLTLQSTMNGTKGKILFGSSTFGFNEAAGQLFLGTASPLAGTTIHAHQSLNGVYLPLFMTNDSAGASAAVSFRVGLDPTSTSNSTTVTMFGPSSTYGGFYSAYNTVMEANAPGDMVFSQFNAKDFVWTTTALHTERFRIRNNGNVSVASLAGSGVRVAAANSNGDFTIASAGDIGSTLNIPIDRVFFSGGSAAAPTSNSRFTYDHGADFVTVGAGAALALYGLGSSDSNANLQRVRFRFGSNQLLIGSEARGTGVVPDIKVDADVATLRLNGASVTTTATTATTTATNVTVTGSTQVVLGSGGSPAPDIYISPTEVSLRSNAVRDSASNLFLNGVSFNGSATLTGSSHVTTPQAFNYFSQPGLSTSALVDEATTAYFVGPPILSGFGTINALYTMHVASGIARFDGDGSGRIFEVPSNLSGMTSTTAVARIPVLVTGVGLRYLHLYAD